MQYSVNTRSPVPVYVQIENLICFDIATGRLKPGAQVPTLRDLATRLKVHVNTVVRAFQDLNARGAMDTRRGEGVYVSKGAQAKCRKYCRELAVARLFEAVLEAKSAGMSRKEVSDIFTSTCSLNIGPYTDVPRDIAALAE